MQALSINTVGVAVYRVPVDTPVQTSFGVLKDRAAVVVRLADADGVEGWGEIWCNFPTVGAEHRARLLMATVAPLVLSRDWSSADDCHAALTDALRVLAIQCGEPGSLSQVIAGVNIAMWDLAARRAAVPLWRLLGGASPRVRVYASGLNPTQPERLAAAKAREGYTAFKLKVGFGIERDDANLACLRAELGGTATLMIDANQAWDTDEALRSAQRLARHGLLWLEEPIAADAPISEWQRLAQGCAVPLAAGENLRGDDFARFIDTRVLRAVQPDVAKWGGFSGCLPLAGAATAGGIWLCPHWLGGGIGLLATLHLKAAAAGEGFAEVDANPNPLRELLSGGVPPIRHGEMTLPDSPGLGAQPDLAALQRYLTLQDTLTRKHLSQGQTP